MYLLDRFYEMRDGKCAWLRFEVIRRDGCGGVDRVVEEIALCVDNEVVWNAVLDCEFRVDVLLYEEVYVLLIVEVLNEELDVYEFVFGFWVFVEEK